jgi:hypothetical protein
MQPFEPINLDAIATDGADMFHVCHVLRDLAEYARVKSNAMALREKGHIRSAQEAEAHCERIYNELPKWARW